LSSFLEGPNAVITLSNEENQELATVNIVNIFSPENEITLHIPGNKKLPGNYKVNVEVFYAEEEEIEQDGEQRLSFKQSLVESLKLTDFLGNNPLYFGIYKKQRRRSRVCV
jgi:hypothetical protein